MELAVSKLKEGADIIRATLNEVRLIQDADSSARRSQDIVDKMIDCAATLDSPASNPDLVLQELRQLDAAHRREVQTITEIKVRLHQSSCCFRVALNHHSVELVHSAITGYSTAYQSPQQ